MDLGRIMKAFFSQNAFAIVGVLLSIIVIGYQRDINRRFDDLREDGKASNAKVNVLEDRLNAESLSELQRVTIVEESNKRILERLDRVEVQLEKIRELQVEASMRDAGKK